MQSVTLRCIHSITLFVVALATYSTNAGNLGGVFGPKLSPAERSLQYRYAIAPGENGQQDNWGHRLHYQHALNADYRLRGVLQYRDNQGGHEFDQARFEIHWQYQHSQRDGRKLDSAVRLDFVARDGDRPNEIGLNWTHQWQLGQRWSAQAVLLTLWQFGDNDADGILINSRYSVSYKTQGGLNLSLESYNTHGSSEKFRDFNDTPQQIGPSVSGVFAGMGYKIGYLAGLNDVTADDTFTLWLTHKF